MRCPKCRTQELVAHDVEDTTVNVDVCPTCNGVWFDAGELEATLADLAVDDLRVPSRSKRAPFVCPRCGKMMFAFNYPQTFAQIDMCKNCGGVWLDANEYEEIAAVRHKHKLDGKLEKQAPPSGVKGGLIKMINDAIAGLAKFD